MIFFCKFEFFGISEDYEVVRQKNKIYPEFTLF